MFCNFYKLILLSTLFTCTIPQSCSFSIEGAFVIWIYIVEINYFIKNSNFYFIINSVWSYQKYPVKTVIFLYMKIVTYCDMYTVIPPVACQFNCVSFLLTDRDISQERDPHNSTPEFIPNWWRKICPETGQQLLLVKLVILNNYCKL